MSKNHKTSREQQKLRRNARLENKREANRRRGKILSSTSNIHLSKQLFKKTSMKYLVITVAVVSGTFFPLRYLLFALICRSFLLHV